MELHDLILTVESSSSDEWHRMDHHTLHGWEWGDRNINGEMYPYIEPKTHHNLAVFKKDVDVSIVFGADVIKDFAEPWVQAFPDPKASSILVVLRYRGQVVFEWVFVVVDGGRYLLPLPKPLGNGQYQFAQDKLPFARLMFALYGQGGVHHSLEDTLKRAGVTIV